MREHFHRGNLVERLCHGLRGWRVEERQPVRSAEAGAADRCAAVVHVQTKGTANARATEALKADVTKLVEQREHAIEADG